MSRKRKIAMLVVSLALALLPAIALAAEGSPSRGELLLRVNGPVNIGPNETHEAVIVINDDATVNGTITGALFVVGGDAVVAGRVGGDVTVVRGTLTLAPTARVKNVSVIRGDLVRDPGATVTGTVSKSDLVIDAWVWSVFSALVWFGMTLVILAAGLIYAAIAGRQLKATGDLIVEEPGPTLLAAALLWIAMPILMVVAVATIIGIPFGVGYFLIILPVLWFIGYLVAGTQLGRTVLRARGEGERPYVAAAVGLLILQVVGLVPVAGVIAFLAGVVGAGALGLMAWRSWRGPRTRPAAPPMPTP
ncbi:MAG: polymer-forming cytoskeletal protein, partial [Thermomicrobiaceae bacterium]|nr:polymer-forming cytoskeletal protein [Thermomicrobiaceae bacterium]